MVDHRKLERLVDEDAIDELFRLVTWDEAAQAWHRHSLWRRAVAAKDVDIAEHPDWWAKALWHSTMLWDTGEMVRYASRAQIRRLALLVIGLSPALRLALSAYGVNLYTNVFCRLEGAGQPRPLASLGPP